jgi:uncharacterized protein YbjT (DUF2867 family)
MSALRCLVTGASGYVGGRLVPLLLAHGHQVRWLVRSAHRLRDVPWAGQVEIVEGDVTHPVHGGGTVPSKQREGWLAWFA